MSLKTHALVKDFEALKSLKNLLSFHTHNNLCAMTATPFFRQKNREKCFQHLSITHTDS